MRLLSALTMLSNPRFGRSAAKEESPGLMGNHRVFSVFTVYGLAAWTAFAGQGAPDGQWPHYGADAGATKYSALSQIDASNVGDLTIAWTWDSPDNALAAENRRLFPFFYEATPLYVGGVLYTTSSLGFVIAINPATGEENWKFDTKSYEHGRPTNLGFVNRGPSYWTDGEIERVYIATGNAFLWSIDANTGKADPNFGEDGVVDLTQHMRREVDRRVYGVTSPPMAIDDKLVIGSSIFDGPNNKEMPPGDVRAFDARTGELAWTFKNPPESGEFGSETWEGGAEKYTGNANVWTLFSADPELGYVYLSFGTPTNDWYGGHRHGDGLFAESIVCVKASTGERVWHYQTTHHGVWDYDLCAAAALADVTIDGKERKVLAQPTKQGFLFVLDRVTGEPIWPIEERPVPASTATGEKLSPTQPHPTKPAPYERQGMSRDELIDFTPELRAEAEKTLAQFNYGSLFTPPMEGKSTIYLPGWNGGGNWGGIGIDPETGIGYIASIASPIAIELVKPDAARSNFNLVGKLQTNIPGPQGLPLLKPPYGSITAIDLNSGEHVWRVAHGPGPKDHPLLKDMNLGDLGDSDRGYPLVTKTLLFMAQDGGGRGARGGESEPSPNFRAFDKATGKVVWETVLPASPTAAPMTYMHEGKQYIGISVGGLMAPAKLVALALP